MKRGAQSAVILAGLGMLAGAVSAHQNALEARDQTKAFAQTTAGGLSDEERRWNHGVAWTTMEQQGNLAGALYGIGTTVLASGLTWLLLDLRAQDETKTEVAGTLRATLAPLPSGGAVLVRSPF